MTDSFHFSTRAEGKDRSMEEREEPEPWRLSWQLTPILLKYLNIAVKIYYLKREGRVCFVKTPVVYFLMNKFNENNFLVLLNHMLGALDRI